MYRRVHTLFFAFIALIIVYSLLAQQKMVLGPISVPTSEDASDSGLKVLHEWLDSSGIPVMSFRQRYSQLIENSDLPASGNLLLTILPHKFKHRYEEMEYLKHWLNRGNNILIMFARYDQPPWSLRNLFYSDDFLGEFGLHPGNSAPGNDDEIETEETEDEVIKKLQDMIKHETSSLESTIDQPSVNHVTGVSVKHWVGATPIPADYIGSYALNLLKNPQGQTSLWQVNKEGYIIWLSPYADLMSNANLQQGDNGRLLVNLINLSLVGNGKLLIDDFHQGLSSVYNAEHFFADDRWHNSLKFIALFWLLYVIGSDNRFAPIPDNKTKPSALEHTMALANLISRRLNNPAVASRLFHHFFNEIRSTHHLPLNGKPVWKILSAHKNLEPEPVRRLQLHYVNCNQGTKVNLMDIISQTQTIRKQLQ